VAALPLHLAPGLRIATYLIVTAVAWLYRGRARETGQTKAPAAAMALWAVFGIALLLAINGRSTGFLPVKVARALLVIATPALRLSWLFSGGLWREVCALSANSQSAKVQILDDRDRCMCRCLPGYVGSAGSIAH
jgi:hypothetical protein